MTHFGNFNGWTTQCRTRVIVVCTFFDSPIYARGVFKTITRVLANDQQLYAVKIYTRNDILLGYEMQLYYYNTYYTRARRR